MRFLNGFNFFLLSPNREKAGQFTFYELDKESQKNLSLISKTFCVIPYKNPKNKISEALFYTIISERDIDLGDNLDLMSPKIKPLKLSACTSKENYIKKVTELKEQIQQGNIYEITYCIEFFAENAELDPISVYQKLNELTKAPYSSLVKLGDDYIISASPELFLKKAANILCTKPIKGTIKRGKTLEEDNELKDHLFTSLKERTENVMAVDVARNDLSVIAKRGTVEVNKLYNIETYETVHQMVSTISCELKDNLNFKDLIAATFPMASMTGAPKISAMNLIDTVEDFKRNYYSGAMGIIDEKGDFNLSVNIRCIFYNPSTKRLSIAVGSAITHLCDPEKEYEECLLKADALLKAMNAATE